MGARKILENDDGGNAKEANARAIAEIESAEQEEAGKPKPKEPDGPITVNLDDDEEDEAPRQAGQRTPRDENRRNRYREQVEARERAERERDELKGKYSEIEGRLNQITQQLQSPRQPDGGAQPGTHPAVAREQELRRLMQETSEEFDMLSPEAKNKPEIRKRYSERYQAYDTERQRLNAYIANGAPAQPQNQHQNNMQVMLMARYPDVMSKGEHFQYADASYKRLIATGAPDNWDTIDKAMEETRRQFRLGKAPPPSQATKARYSGVGSGANGTASGGGSRKIELTKEDRVMARHAFPKLKQEDAYKAFAKMLAKGQDA